MDDYFKSAVVYYFKYLVEHGYNDPVKVIINDFLDTIKITDEQKKFIYNNNKVESNTVDNMMVLIKKMRISNEIDQEALKLIEDGLKKML